MPINRYNRGITPKPFANCSFIPQENVKKIASKKTGTESLNVGTFTPMEIAPDSNLVDFGNEKSMSVSVNIINKEEP
jgi:hypothetical protein